MRGRPPKNPCLISATPTDLSLRKINVSDLGRAICDICEKELKHTMTYTWQGDGVVEISLPALGHGLSLFLTAIGRRTVLELEALIDGDYFTIICRPGEGLPSRRELAEVSIAMRRAGFDFFLQGDVVLLRTDLKASSVLTVYAGDAVGIGYSLRLELFDFVNKYLHNDE